MLTGIDRFVNWMRRRNPNAHTWRDYRGDWRQFLSGAKLADGRRHCFLGIKPRLQEVQNS